MGVEVGHKKSKFSDPVQKFRVAERRSLGTEELSSQHRRSKSFPDKGVKGGILPDSQQACDQMKLEIDMAKAHNSDEKNQCQTTLSQKSLKKEIIHLEKRLHDQFSTRRALEMALGSKSSLRFSSLDSSMPKSAKQLVHEIAMLELEVMHLEQYLLSLYRKAFNQQVSVSPATNYSILKTPFAETGLDATFRKVHTDKVISGEKVQPESIQVTKTKQLSEAKQMENLMDSSVQRSHSSLSYRSKFPNKVSPSLENLGRSLRSCHSQPLSFMQYMQSGTSVISLAEHLGARISDHVPETPNKLSENIIRCMSGIYCKLAEPPLVHYGNSSSPSSSLSSSGAFSPLYQSDMWSPNCTKESSCDAQFENSFQVDETKEISEPSCSMIEVSSICRDNGRLNDIDHLLQNFKSLIQRLEKVDLSEMKHEEKLAFWINIHNALVMHAYLVYGIPQNNSKRGALLVKAAYNIGGRTFSAETIETTVLGCRSIRPGKWLRTFFLPKIKLKGAERQSFAIDHAEPSLYFSLCTGCHSDPMVRIYTAKRVIQELETAREEYLRATISVGKENKILLPKIADYFAKDSNLNWIEMINLVRHYLPQTLQKSIQRIKDKSQRNVEWIPHNFSFRYLLSKELVK